MVSSSERVIRLDIANSVHGNDLLIVSVNVFISSAQRDEVSRPFRLFVPTCRINFNYQVSFLELV